MLDGQAEACDGTRHLRSMGPGELFGEGAFLRNGRRTTSVRARPDSRMLILRGRSVKKLMRRDPALESSLQIRLSTLMSERSASTAAV